MDCPNCKDTKLSVLHVYMASATTETRDLRCPACGFKSSSITLLVPRPQDQGGSWRGRKGAWALAQRLKKGQLRDILDE